MGKIKNLQNFWVFCFKDIKLNFWAAKGLANIRFHEYSVLEFIEHLCYVSSMTDWIDKSLNIKQIFYFSHLGLLLHFGLFEEFQNQMVTIWKPDSDFSHIFKFSVCRTAKVCHFGRYIAIIWISNSLFY